MSVKVKRFCERRLVHFSIKEIVIIGKDVFSIHSCDATQQDIVDSIGSTKADDCIVEYRVFSSAFSFVHDHFNEIVCPIAGLGYGMQRQRAKGGIERSKVR